MAYMQSKSKAAIKKTSVSTGKKKRLTKSDFQLYSMCLIPILHVILFKYVPMFGIILAFKKYKYNLGILGSPWVGFQNFKWFVQSDVFVELIRNTIGNNLLFIAASTIAAIVLAIVMFEITSKKATKVIQTMMIAPHFMSYVIVAYIVYAILNPSYGYMNQLLGLFGIEGIDWYSKPLVWPFILMIVSVWKGVGMSSIYYYSTLMGIDTSLFEAAEIDGAKKMQIIWHIVLPFLVPIIVILTVLSIGSIFHADFGLFYTVTQDGANGNLYSTTNVIDTYIYRMFKGGGKDYGMTTAVGLMQSVVGMALVITTNWLSKKIDPDYGLF